MTKQYTLAIRTDTPDAYIAIIDGDGTTHEYSWHAMRALSDELLQKIRDLLQAQNIDWKDISGVIVYKGPGSFTGLRIGVTVATTLAYSLDVGVVGTTQDHWIEDGQALLASNPYARSVQIEYGQEANITRPKK